MASPFALPVVRRESDALDAWENALESVPATGACGRSIETIKKTRVCRLDDMHHRNLDK
jgi:hypothetical protein